mgnify:CR=1 FL=1
MVDRATALAAEDAEAVRVIHHQPGVAAARHRRERRVELRHRRVGRRPRDEGTGDQAVGLVRLLLRRRRRPMCRRLRQNQ